MIYPGSLHNHTEYSNLDCRDSTNRINTLIDRAIELGQEVIAFTEHENVCNSIKIEKYYNKIKEANPNFKVIRGNEIYLCRNGLNQETFEKGKDRYWHFILLAKDAEGHKQIRELSTRAWLRSYRTGKNTRRPTYYQDLKEIIGANPGHVIGSTACLGGFFASKILQIESEEDKENLVKWLNNMVKIFGKDDFYLEMQPSDQEEQKIVNQAIVQFANELDLKYIITCDAHYLRKEDRFVHKAFLQAQDGEREVDSFYEATYLMDDDEVRERLSYLTSEQVEQAYNNILSIKEKCEDYSLLKPLKIPSLVWREPKPIKFGRTDYYCAKMPMMKKFWDSDFKGDQVLVKLIMNKFEENPQFQTKEYYDEINSNLESTWISSEVNKTHWSAYFLNLQKNIDICWDSGTLVGPGRGSGVGFLLLYFLDIIQIDKIRERTPTFAWRFLNPERVSVLDIDTDIEGGRRAQTLEALRNFYGQDRIANVVTFGTESSKSAIQTAARGLGVSLEEAVYISSLVPSDRGITRSLAQCYYGDPANNMEPIALFKKEMDNNPELWQVAQNIEDLVCRVGEHAGGVIFVDEPFTESTALMKVPNGDVVTQFDLHDCEDASLIKIDLLSVECLDKIHTELDLLVQYGKIKPEATLKETYEKYLGIYSLERDNPDMWKMVWNHEIQSLFQMEKQSGIQGIGILKPTSVDDLAILNSTIRLMTQEGATEAPTEKLARFKNNPKAWDEELAEWGLGEREKEILEPVVGISYGLMIAQEQIMSVVQLPELGGFSLTWGDKLRKAIAKKNPADFEKLEEEFYRVNKEKNIKENFTKYVWQVLISMSKGYGFNQSHTLAYSLVALQEMNLAYKYPIIYWNAACLISDTGGVEGGANNYTKLATGINKMQSNGIKIMLPDINKSTSTFTIDEANNSIIFGLSGIQGVGTDMIANIINNRPYTSIQDFLDKTNSNKSVTIALIKSGAFDQFGERSELMRWYITKTSDLKNNLTLQNLAMLFSADLLPKDGDYLEAYKVYQFNKYLKAHNNQLDERALNFLANYNFESVIKSDMTINEKLWKKVYDKEMDLYRNYITDHKEELLDIINNQLIETNWNKYAQGSYSAWEMETVCFYYHEHELANINKNLYNISDFFELPEEPEVDKIYNIRGKEVKLFRLHKICGTCISKDSAKSTVQILTTTGVVEVKFNKEYFSIFDKAVSVKGPDGKKKIIEDSWFNRGNKILLQGVRRGNQFVPKKYKNSAMQHRLYKIIDVDKDNNLVLQGERLGEEECL